MSNGVTANAVHPGLVLTEVTRNFNPVIQMLYAIANPVMRTLQKSPR
jgi:NAD(P)-dependent dehydrogenase (short-subunit alcohol dehydrogenase family)